jgi:poly-beta-1,6-N-acetyl-D-glucosamine synthase
MTLSVTIGIPAYNEEGNIGNLLEALTHQHTEHVNISEIIVVSSGSTDKTCSIVKEKSWADSRIKLISQDRRKGKASAINELLNFAHDRILVLESADTLPGQETIERLCLSFNDANVGMTGAHPVPTNSYSSFMGYICHLQWALHDRIALRTPKCGELVAFRRVFDKVPEDIAVDEAWIEFAITKRNYKIVYVPDAIVYNRGPETIHDFLSQRRRIAYGHLDLDKRTKFEVSTNKAASTLPAILEVLPIRNPKKLFFFVSAFALEAIGRSLGYYDYYIKDRHHSVWEISKTTKSLGINVT